MRRKKVSKEDGEHEINFTITIAKASVIDYDAIGNNHRKKIRAVEAPKAQSYLHCSYKLLPDDKETVKTDVVMFGVAAKLYTEHDSRVLRTWIDGDKTWVAWTNTHKVRVTKDVLLRIFNHTVELKLWDTKEKVSPRARFDRPKAFKLPPQRGNEEAEIDSIKRLIAEEMRERLEARKKQRRNTSYNQDGVEDGKGRRPGDSTKSKAEAKKTTSPGTKVASPSKPQQRSSESNADRREEQPTNENVPQEGKTDEEVKQQPTGNSSQLDSPKPEEGQGIAPQSSDYSGSVKVKVFLDEKNQPQMANLMKLASSGINQSTDDEENEENQPLVLGKSTSKTEKGSTSPGRSSRSKSLAADRQAELLAAHIRVHGLASVRVKLSALFTGAKTIHSRLDTATGTVEDLVVTLSVDTALLSEPQRMALNPMIINVSSACNMPSRPMSYAELQKRCVQPYISYKFHNEAIHDARGSQHAAKIAFNDTHVVLLGIQDRAKLFEYFRGPGLEIEVHDRDRDTSLKRDIPTIFGNHVDDHMINKASLITSRRTEHNAFTGKGNSWDPYGVARLDLSDLLLGERIIEFSLPIRSCKIPDVLDGKGGGNYSEKIVGKPGNVDGPEDIPLVAANYIEAGSELKTKIEIAYPMQPLEQTHTKTVGENTTECPFARLVCSFDYKSKGLLKDIQKEVMAVNAETLQLKDFPDHVIEAALSTYKLTDSQRSSKTLNIITGFQVIDGKYHIFVLEGLRDLGMKKVWDSLSNDDQNKHHVKKLYNTDISFQERLYATLDVDLTRVRLHQPLDTIVKLPLFYVRDMVPRLCLQAVLKLHELVNCQRLRDAVRNEMFPTDEMIASLSKEFGIPLTMEDIKETTDDHDYAINLENEIFQTSRGSEEKPYRTTRPWTPLQLRNEIYDEVLKERAAAANRKNFLADNISKLQRLEPVTRERTITCDPSTLPNNEAHNYSIQTFNTTELAKRKLRDSLSEDRDSRFTYSQQFQGATVLPIDPVSVGQEERLESQKTWITSQGFVYPGKKSSRESNKHPMEPDFARLDELKKPWRENILHSNKLKPTVNRVKFSWENRSQDFELFKKPKEYLTKPGPFSIHLSGDTLAAERRRFDTDEQKAWEKSLVVDDARLRTHRCSTQTELLQKGLKSSSQLARLDDVLKGQPRKHALSAPGLRLEKIPALSVVFNPTLDPALTFYDRLRVGSDLGTGVERCKSYNPGPFEGRSWLLEENRVPTCDYNHGSFIDKNGADFKLCHPPKQVVYKRSLKPLTQDEKATHLFHEKSAQII